MDPKIDDLKTSCVEMEGRAAALQSRLQAVTSGRAACDDDEELRALQTANKALQYRANILTKQINTEYSAEEIASVRSSKASSCSPPTSDLTVPEDRMCAIIGHLEAVFVTAVTKAFPELTVALKVPLSQSKMEADYQCNVAMALAKSLKKPPRGVAEAVVAAAPPSPLVEKLTVSGAGFINVFLKQDFIQQQVLRLVSHGVTAPPTAAKRVIVDFSSPNIAKEMHVGHLRSTIIGDTICRLLEFLGHDVRRINHLGDWGTQFGMLIAHLQDTFPNYLAEPPQIADLQSFYKASKKRFDEDEEFKKRAYAAVVALQSGSEDHTRGWRMICDISKREFDKVYDRLNIKLTPIGESFYQSRMEDIVKDLKGRGLLKQEDGRWLMFPEEKEVPLTVVKSDGGFTYDTSDLTCCKYRVDEMKGDWLIYVTDAGQAQHFKSFLACARTAGIYSPANTRVDHVMFGMVLGEDKKKFKTRSGDTVRLAELLEEGVTRAQEVLKSKGRHEVLSAEEFSRAARAVAYGCVKYADLCHDRIRDYVFSFDRMLSFSGNTAAYLLYALTRICSIARTAGVSPEDLRASAHTLELGHEKELKLARTLLKLPDIMVRAAEDLYLHPLCEYLYEVSTVFTEFYDKCYCVEKDASGKIVKIHKHRLLLCEATATVFKHCFSILGITPLDKM